MINPTCDKCKQELTEFGALLFSPPKENKVTKYHLCVACYDDITDKLQKA